MTNETGARGPRVASMSDDGPTITPTQWFPRAGNPHGCWLCGDGISYFTSLLPPKNNRVYWCGRWTQFAGRLLQLINRQRS